MSLNNLKGLKTSYFFSTVTFSLLDCLFQEKLNHAAFITRTGRKNVFQICRCHKKKHSKASRHMDFKFMLSDIYSLNLQNGEATYMVCIAIIPFKISHRL